MTFALVLLAAWCLVAVPAALVVAAVMGSADRHDPRIRGEPDGRGPGPTV